MEGYSSLIVERVFKKEYECLFDKFATGILVINQLGMIEEINLYACNQFGLECDQLVNQPISTIKETGTGLGLAHASRVMEDLRDRIEVANNLAGGASFYYFFPTAVYV